MSPLKKPTTYIALGALIGLLSGYGLASIRSHSQLAAVIEAFHPLRLPEGSDSLVRPLFAYETPEATSLNEYKQLKSTIEDRIEERKGHESQTVSVYYRNLNTGVWIGINENAYFYPASLLKVPAMIAYFKQAESNPSVLNEKITYRPISGGDPFEAPSALKPGTRYSARELIRHMIVDSDNGATYTLIENIDPVILDGVYTDLGITKPGEDTSQYQISTKIYALFFRILYNATYLSPSHSKEALELLTEASYRDGLVAGIPSTTVVAHKFGEHVVSADRKNDEGVELHDCGIIYNPNQHYLLCVMTRAESLEVAQDLIKLISKEVYRAVKEN